MSVRALLPIALVCGALALSGCGSEATGEPELAIYLSTPLSGPRADDGRDIADGAELALADAGGEVAGTAVALDVLDDGDEDGWQAALSGANARRATEDASAIAYIGELDSGATRTSLPITNEAGLLQVSAGSSADDLTRDVLGSDRIPDLVQPSGTRTFGRVIPSDRAQGEAAGAWLADMGIASVELIGDEDAFSASLSDGFESVDDAPAITSSDPEATYLATADPPGAGEQGSIFGSDALLGAPGVSALEDASLTSAAMDPMQLPPEAGEFLDAFEEEYGRPPGRYAAYGYEAMALTLDSIGRADDPLDRGAVVDAFFATADRESILGTYSIDEVGDTTLSDLGAYEIADDKAVPLPGPLQRR